MGTPSTSFNEQVANRLRHLCPGCFKEAERHTSYGRKHDDWPNANAYEMLLLLRRFQTRPGPAHSCRGALGHPRKLRVGKLNLFAHYQTQDAIDRLTPGRRNIHIHGDPPDMVLNASVTNAAASATLNVNVEWVEEK